MSPLSRAGQPATATSGPAAGPDVAPGRISDAGPDPAARRAAVAQLGGDPAAVPDLLSCFGSETDPNVREALCTQLARHDRDDVAAAMALALRSPDAGVRQGAVQVLVRTGSATARLLPGLLADPDPGVRTHAVMILAGTPGEQAAALLRATVRSDSHPNVVSAAVSELVSRFGPRCAPDVLPAAQRFPDDPYVAFACAQVAGGAGARP